MPEVEENPDATEPAPEPGGTDDQPPTEPPTSRTKPARRGGTAVVVALILAFVVALSGVGAWFIASSSDDLQSARTRDAIAVAAHQGIETLNSLDYRSIDEGLKDWVSVSTGTLADQLAGVSDDDRALLAEQKKISTGTVLSAAVVDMDATTATVIAAVEVTVADGTDTNAEPAVKRNRFSADMVLVKGEWKVENLQQVPVNLQ